MLPDFFKLHIVNNTGVTLDFSTNSANEALVITCRLWKLDSNGALVYSTETTLLTAASDLTDGNNEEGSEYNNSSNKYMGLHGFADFKTDNGSASGTVDIYYEYPTDGAAGDYPSDKTNFDAQVDLKFLGSIVVGGAHVRGVNFEL